MVGLDYKPWGSSYNTNHQYDFIFVGTGSKVGFWINDSYYRDNSGSLTIQIGLWQGQPSASSLNVSPSTMIASVDQTVQFSGSVEDQYGNGLPYASVGIEDPISEITTSVQTNSNGQFTYSISANRPGDFDFKFFIDSLEQTCTAQVQFLNSVWAGQSLTVSNGETDSYSLQVIINSNPIGSFTIAPGQQQTLWMAPNPISSNTFDVTVTNSRTNDVYKIDANSMSTYVPDQAGLSDIPMNPKLSDYKILTTDTCNSQSNNIIDPESHTACDSTWMYTGTSQNSNLRTEFGLTQGPEADIGSDIYVGCHAFIGYKAECSASCGVSGGMQIGFKLGLAFPIQPVLEHGCGWGCKISFGDIGCDGSISVSAQAGYEAKIGAGIKYTYHCPVEATLSDPLGREAGYIPNVDNTTLVRYIPGANYTGAQAEPQSIYIPSPLQGNYGMTLVGTDNGTCTINLQIYDSNGTITDSDEWQYEVIQGEKYTENITLDPGGIIILPHNIRVNSIESKTSVGQSYSFPIGTVVANRGNYSENFNVTVYVNGEPIASFVNVTLDSRNITTLVCTWNTTVLGNYTVSAYAWPVPGETDTADNNFTGGAVTVTIPGDINGDFKVSLSDLSILAKAYGTTPASPNWNPNADINGDGKVSLSDLSILAKHYGQHYP